MMAVWSWTDRNALRMARRFEAAHDLFSSSCVSMGRLRTVVQPVVRTVINTWVKIRDGCAVAARHAHHFISFSVKHLAALAFLRHCNKISRTSPFASTARQSHCFLPRIEVTTSSRCHLSTGTGRSRRIPAAIWVPNLLHQI